ncbi:hypothetical protein DV737_g3744, partial [Chaetothyriales sp. CBS 132003]
MASSDAAPAYCIPRRQVVAVEHPCIVRNIDRAIDMLGGAASVKQILAPGPPKPLGLNLQPANPDSRPILSFNNQTNNLLLQVRVPKRIGKRKRGSDAPFTALDSADALRNARYLVQSMRDNAATHQVDALGTVDQTHIWREMPDFVYSTQDADFLSKVRSQLLPRDLQSVKSFNMHRRHGLLGSEAVPPPVLSTVSLPHPASYRQDTGSRAWPPSSDHAGGTEPAVNINTSNPRPSMTSVTTFADGCPMSPDPSLPPLSFQPKAIRELYPLLADLFKQRPLWTRRALVGQLPPDASSDRLRFTLPYLAFLIRAGPWRDCLCRFGIDPTSSPDFRVYQTLCDIADPQLTRLVHLPVQDLPSHCDTKCFGWYPNGALSKIRTVMKAKLDACTAQGQQQQPIDATLFDRFLSLLPNQLDHFDPAAAGMGDPDFGYLPPPMTPLEMELAATYRGIAREEMNKELRRAGRRPAPVEIVDDDAAGGESDEEEEADNVFITNLLLK